MHRGRLSDMRLRNCIGKSHRRMIRDEGITLSDERLRYGNAITQRSDEGLRYNINCWMRGLIGGWTGDRYIASAEGKGS